VHKNFTVKLGGGGQFIYNISETSWAILYSQKYETRVNQRGEGLHIDRPRPKAAASAIRMHMASLSIYEHGDFSPWHVTNIIQLQEAWSLKTKVLSVMQT